MARYRRTDTGQNLAVSNEITGYAVSTFLYLYERSGQREYLDRALTAARFLTRKAWDPQLKTFPFEYVPPGNGFAYFFDCGIIVRGLLGAWRKTGETEFLDIAQACGRSMARDFAGEQCFYPILRLPEKRPVACEHRWSRGPGCYQLKSAMGWFDLYEISGDEDLLAGYRQALDFSLRTCDSFLPGESDVSRVVDRLHAFCYFLEGMLPVAGEEPCQAALDAGIKSVAHYLRKHEPQFVRSDVYAQLLRVRLFADQAGIVALDREAAQFEAARLAEFQSAETEPQAAGGFWFGRKGGEVLPFINPVSAGFGLQALDMWNDYDRGGPPLDRHSLI